MLSLPFPSPFDSLLRGEKKRRSCRRGEHLWSEETKIVASQSDSRSKRDADRSVIVKEEEGNRGRSQLPERDAWREVVGRRSSSAEDGANCSIHLGGRRVNAEGGGGVEEGRRLKAVAVARSRGKTKLACLRGEEE